MNILFRSLIISTVIFRITVPVPMTFTVLNTNDSGAGSLRQAILDNNANVGFTNTIDFAIPGAGPHTIQPATDLDAITNPVIIDGYSQTGATANNQFFGNNAVIQIIINGNAYQTGDGVTTGNGLTFRGGSSGSIVTGLCINEWIDCGILIDGFEGPANNISIGGNFIGTDVTGTQVLANRIGIGVSGDSTGVGPVTGTAIGTQAFEDRNIIAGSFGHSVIDDYLLRGACISLFDHLNTTIYNNYIGTNKEGTAALGNSQVGLYDRLGENTLVGGDIITQRNLVSGHFMYGMRIRDELNGSVINNYVGTNLQGTAALGNSLQGIYFDGETTGVTVRNNLASGNGSGICIGAVALPGTENNIFTANLVGVDESGNLPLGNSLDGIIVNTPNNTIGELGAANLNVISSNGNNGITLTSAIDTLIQNNHIGVDKLGIRIRGNGNHGIQVGLQGGLAGASNNSII